MIKLNMKNAQEERGIHEVTDEPFDYAHGRLTLIF